MSANIPNKENLSPEIKEWINELKKRSTDLMDRYNSRIDAYFMYSILAVTFIYGSGLNVAVTSEIVLWIITVSSITVFFLFAYASSYVYQWMDRERLVVQIIERFFDGKIAIGQSSRTIKYDDLKAVGWNDETNSKSKEFVVISDGKVDWVNVLAYHVAYPHHVINRWSAFARMASVQRRPFLAISFVLVWTSLSIDQVIFNPYFILFISNILGLSISTSSTLVLALLGLVLILIYMSIEYYMKKIIKRRYLHEY